MAYQETEDTPSHITKRGVYYSFDTHTGFLAEQKDF